MQQAVQKLSTSTNLIASNCKDKKSEQQTDDDKDYGMYSGQTTT